MMIIINVMKETAFSSGWRSVGQGRQGEPFRLMIILSVVTAVISALLDNVTTAPRGPVTLLICEALEVDVIPFLIRGDRFEHRGTATLIDDPPNIMIASKADLSFMDFIYHLTPVVIVIDAYLVTLKFIFGRSLRVSDSHKERVMAMDESTAITDRPLMVKSLWVMGFVVLGFVFHHQLHFQPATIALAGAALLLLLSRAEPHKILEAVEWPTLFFFVGLFIIIGGVVKVGLIRS
jgi:Na+/H+ antiporter NhaD/arsenite permease-like protein